MANGGIIGPVQNPIIDNTSTTQSFTASGTFTSRANQPSIDFLVVAGGGGGGSYYYAGAGGAGGFRTSYPGGSGGGASPESRLNVSGNTSYPVVVVAGGATATGAFSNGNPGNPSSFNPGPNGITSTGGGYGASGGPSDAFPGNGGPGGSGGGVGLGNTRTLGAGTANQGYPGSNINYPPGLAGSNTSTGSGGGAGGAGIVGTNGPGGSGSSGGVGKESTISGSPVFYAGGGGGSIYSGTPGPGGNGGGGRGAGSSATVPAIAGTVNTGGGGGAASHCAGGPGTANGAAGGSGIVIIVQPSFAVAPGVWSINDAYNYKKAGQWS